MSVEAALTLLRDRSFDLLVFDLRLPDGFGYELLDRVRQKLGKLTPALAVTGFDSREYREASRRAGFASYLLKPIDASTFVHTALRVLRAGHGPSA